MNKKISSIILIILSLILITNGQEKNDEKNTFSSWINYSSKEGKFQVKFPEKPKLSIAKLDTVAGVRENNWFTVNQPGKQFAVSYTDFQTLPKMNEKDLKQNYDNVRDGTVKQTNAKIISDKDIWLNDYFGRELVMKLGDETITARMYLVDQRLYQAIFTIKDKYKNETETQNFLNSFVINE